MQLEATHPLSGIPPQLQHPAVECIYVTTHLLSGIPQQLQHPAALPGPHCHAHLTPAVCVPTAQCLCDAVAPQRDENGRKLDCVNTARMCSVARSCFRGASIPQPAPSVADSDPAVQALVTLNPKLVCLASSLCWLDDCTQLTAISSL